MSSGDPGGLEAHLRDAIRLNRSRRAGYEQAGGWRAGLVSRLLVGSERSLIPVARGLDRWSDRHAPPILRAEIVSMDDAPAASRTVPLPSVQSVREAVGRGRTSGTRLARISASIIRQSVALRRRAAERGRHVELTAHVLESAALMAGRGDSYARATGGRTRLLSWALVLGHLGLVPAAMLLDRLAVPLHRRGVGILVNDLPPIPRP